MTARQPLTVPVYCARRARADLSPRYSGSYITRGRRPLERVGLARARRQPDGSYRCDECGVRVPVAW